ncbi:MAG: DUF1553 domain-containing protein [Planctomycetes bacterium]|nr:DUF1553 domain-containing protein [Planctomycetota bacterium]MCL4731439.1 DUF1553 domain-containing protein [Planctomycetota bacterium]
MFSMRVKLLATGAMFLGAVSFGVAAAQDAPKPAEPAPDKTTESKPSRPVTEKDLSAAIDREIAKVWARDKITPTGLSSDEEFVRRVYFDLTGLPPTREETLAFLDSKDKNKREALINRLLDDKRFGEHMGDLWSNIMLGRGGRGDRGGGGTLLAIWFAERFNNNARFSDIIYDLVTAQGKTSVNPAVSIYTREQPFSIANAAGLVTRTLTGVQLQCAECHDHPYEDAWKQTTFQGVASFFSPIQSRQNLRILPVDPEVTDDAREVRLPPAMGENVPAELRQALEQRGRYNRPVTLDGKPVTIPGRDFWRPYLAKWITRKDNRQTARYTANRFWSFAFGIGLLNPVDDFNSFNTPSHPELLDLLADDLVENRYDIKRLYRAMLNSRTYQLSGKGRPAKAEGWHFASSAPRQLSPEQFFGALVTVSGSTEMARGYRGRVGSPAVQVRRQVEARMRQMQRDNPNMRDYDFDEESLKRFESWYEKMSDLWFLRRSMAAGFSSQSSDDEMTDVDGFSLTIDQALAVMNGEFTNRIAGSGRGTIATELVARVKDDSARIEYLYLTVLSRRPTAAETSRLKKYVAEQKDAAAAYEDILFALLAGSEFATNH